MSVVGLINYDLQLSPLKLDYLLKCNLLLNTEGKCLIKKSPIDQVYQGIDASTVLTSVSSAHLCMAERLRIGGR